MFSIVEASSYQTALQLSFLSARRCIKDFRREEKRVIEYPDIKEKDLIYHPISEEVQHEELLSKHRSYFHPQSKQILSHFTYQSYPGISSPLLLTETISNISAAIQSKPYFVVGQITDEREEYQFSWCIDIFGFFCLTINIDHTKQNKVIAYVDQRQSIKHHIQIGNYYTANQDGIVVEFVNNLPDMITVE